MTGEEIIWEITKKSKTPASKVNADLNTHWKRYFEGVIDLDGNWYNLHGSHTSALEGLCSELHKQSIFEIRDNTPKEFYCDYNNYLLSLCHGIAVRYEHSEWVMPTEAAKRTYDKLVSLGKIKGFE